MPVQPSPLTVKPSPLLLVVDDRFENREAMQALLGDDPDWRLRLADSGEAALRVLLQEDVSLVLLDVQMPEMDGYEVARLMRDNPRTRHIPVIFISAIARTQELMLRGYQSGAVDFILKPFDSQLLRQKIHNFLAYENNRREVHALNQQLQSLSITDPLTGLLNRRGFYQEMQTALARAQRNGHTLAVAYLDLDGFKHINDSLGHNAGDKLLRQIGIHLKSTLRHGDSLARMGGDEFIVLINNLHACHNAAAITAKLIESVSARHHLDGKDFALSASIGIACYPDCGEDTDSLLRAADMAMYDAKRRGRQQYCFHTPEMTTRAHARLDLEQRLRHAIDAQHFSLVLQPQFHMDNGQLRGFEALLRWSHNNPDRVSPAHFIPLLEETRLINRLGPWIFSEGIRHLLTSKQRFGEDFVLSLNLSPVQFELSNLVEHLADMLSQHNLTPKQLELEVTEGTLMQNLDLSRERLRQLRELGIKVAIDDFGTGYSSLAYLRQFDLDTLKIDRMFISNMLNSPRDAAIVRAIIDLAHHLNLHVVAEGVETEEQRQWLHAHAPNATLQGWLVAPGLSLEAVMQLPKQVDWARLPLNSAEPAGLGLEARVAR